MRIDSTHQICQQSVRGPFPAGEGPLDYMECLYGCGDLTQECERMEEEEEA